MTENNNSNNEIVNSNDGVNNLTSSGNEVTRKEVDQKLDNAGSEALNKMGVPKPIAKAAIKKNGGMLSPTNLPANRFMKDKSRNTITDVLNRNKNRFQSNRLGNNFFQNSNSENEENEYSNQNQSANQSKGLISSAISNKIGSKLEGPVLNKIKSKIYIYIILALIPIIFLLLLFMIFTGGSEETEQSKDDYYTGEMSDEEFEDFLNTGGYCDGDDCTIAINYYKTVKASLSDVNASERTYYANLMSSILGFGRSNKELYAIDDEEITSLANKLKEFDYSSKTDLSNFDKLKEYITGENGYIDKFRPDLKGEKDKVYEKMISGAKESNRRTKTYVKTKNNIRSGSYCSLGNTQGSDIRKLSNTEFLSVMGPIAQADYSRTGVLASVTLAQAIVESGWGNYIIGKNGLFGIKCTSVTSNSVMSACVNTGTHEELNGSMISIIDGFADYDSVEDSVYDHSLYLTNNSRYSGLTETTDYKKQVHIIKSGGYATASDYESTLNGVIRDFNLDQWDVVANIGSNCSVQGLNGWTIRTIAPTSNDAPYMLDSSNRGQCVWYAKARVIEIVQELAKNGKLTQEQADNIQKKISGVYGDAGEWVKAASPYFRVSQDVNEFKAGSIISWSGGYAGHVAIIEEVTDKTVTVTDAWSSLPGYASCPNDWGCVGFYHNVYDIETFKNSYAPYESSSNKRFVGYIYFLEPRN